MAHHCGDDDLTFESCCSCNMSLHNLLEHTTLDQSLFCRHMQSQFEKRSAGACRNNQKRSTCDAKMFASMTPVCFHELRSHPTLHLTTHQNTECLIKVSFVNTCNCNLKNRILCFSMMGEKIQIQGHL